MALVILAVAAYACNSEDSIPESRISVYSSKKIAGKNNNNETFENKSILFNGEDIEWYDISTEEIKFKENQALVDFRENWTKYDYATFYIDGIKLFTVYITHSHMSLIYDDLTLIDGGYKYYLSHGYPSSIEFSEEKRQKYAVAWDAFIRQLKAEGRLRQSNK